MATGRKRKAVARRVREPSTWAALAAIAAGVAAAKPEYAHIIGAVGAALGLGGVVLPERGPADDAGR